MRLRALLATTAVIACGLTASAEAATPRKACNLVKDAAGDVSNDFAGAPVFQDDPGLDLRGADVASDAKNIAAVFRLGAAPGTATAYAKRYIAQFKVAGLKYPMVLAAAVTPTGTTYSFGYYGPSSTNPTANSFNYSATAATGRIDGTVISVSIALSAVAANADLGTIKRGAKINGFSITANRRVPSLTQVTGQVIVADEATGKGPYYAGGASCIKTTF